MKTLICSLLIALIAVTNCYATNTQVSDGVYVRQTIYANESNNFDFWADLKNTTNAQIIYEDIRASINKADGTFITDIYIGGRTTIPANGTIRIGAGNTYTLGSQVTAGSYLIKINLFTQGYWYLATPQAGKNNPGSLTVINRPYTYTWSISGWSSCNTSCGTGSQTRTATCKRNDGLTVADSYCGTKPSLTQSCTDNSKCATYSWYQGGFGSCDTTCGDGTKTQTVYCKSSSGAQVSDNLCTGTKPANSQICVETSGCATLTYAWSQSGFGSCSVTCGKGNKYQTVTCKDSTGVIALDSKCSGTKPASTISCDETSGCVVLNMPEFLTDGLVAPLRGDTNQTFKFEVRARDLDGENISAQVEVTDPSKSVKTYIMNFIPGSGGSKEGATFSYSTVLAAKGLYSYRYIISSAGDTLKSDYTVGPVVTEPVISIPDGKAKQYLDFLKSKNYDLGEYQGCIEEASRANSCANFLNFRKGTIYYDESSRKLYWNNKATAYNGEWLQAVYPRQHGAYTPYTLQFVWSPFLKSNRNLTYDVQISTTPNFNAGDIFFDTAWIGASIGAESHYRMDEFTAANFFQGRFKQKVYSRIVAKEALTGKAFMYSNQTQFTMWPSAGESFSLFDTAYADGDFGGTAARRSGEDGLKLFEYAFSGYMLFKTGSEAINLTKLYIDYWKLNKAQWGLSTTLRYNPLEMKVFISGFKMTVEGAASLVGIGLIACDVAYDNACTNSILDLLDAYILQTTGMSLGYQGLSFFDNLWYAFIPTTYASDESIRQKTNFEIYLAQYLRDATRLSDDQLRAMSLFLNYHSSSMFTNGRLTPNYLTNITLDKSVLAARSKSSNLLIKAIANNLLWHLSDNKPTGFSPVVGLAAKKVVESDMVDLGLRNYPVGTTISVSQTSGPVVALASNQTFVAPPVSQSGDRLTFKIVANYSGQEVSDNVIVDVSSSGINNLPVGVYKAMAPNGNIVGLSTNQSIIKLELIDPVTSIDARNVPQDMYYFLDVNIKVGSPGQTALLKIHFDKPLPNGYQFLKYNSQLGWYVYPDVLLSADRMTANVTLVDGGKGDDDGLANGIIVDPGGFGIAATNTPTSNGYQTISSPSSAGGGGGGCFIATAAYGSYLHPFVKILRSFRDEFLLTNYLGKQFVKLYYHYSPPLADWLAQHEVAKMIARILLIPLIIFAFLLLTIGPVGLLLCLSLGAIYKWRVHIPKFVHS